MPTYEFECPSCSCRFEVKRSFSEQSPVSCPECRCQARQVFSPVPIIFKGSGFYVTDHKANHGHSTPAGNSDESDSRDTAKVEAGKTDKAKDDG